MEHPQCAALLQPLVADRRRAFYDSVWSEAVAGFDISRARASFADLGIPGEVLRNRRVLDGGCGMGANTLVMAEDFAAQMTAVDISPVSVEITQELARRHGVLIDARVDDLATLHTLPDETFDTLISVGVIHLTGQESACLAGFLRVLAPGGYCYPVLFTRFPDGLQQSVRPRSLALKWPLDWLNPGVRFPLQGASHLPWGMSPPLWSRSGTLKTTVFVPLSPRATQDTSFI